MVLIKSWVLASGSPCGAGIYSKMVSKYAPDTEVVEIKRNDDDVSATAVRQALKADHKERFEELVPQVLYGMYDKLKEIMQAY